MKDVRAVFMNQYAVIVIMIVSVAADVRSFVTDQDFLIRPGGQTFCEDTSGETCPYY